MDRFAMRGIAILVSAKTDSLDIGTATKKENGIRAFAVNAAPVIQKAATAGMDLDYSAAIKRVYGSRAFVIDATSPSLRDPAIARRDELVDRYAIKRNSGIRVVAIVSQRQEKTAAARMD